VSLVAEWKWDAKSPLITTGLYELSGPKGSIATKMLAFDENGERYEEGEDEEEENYDNTMMIDPVMESSGVHMISFKRISGDMATSFGLVDSSAQWNADIDVASSYFSLDLVNGLFGQVNSNFIHFEMVGDIARDDVTTMMVDFEATTFKIWIAGEPYASCTGVPKGSYCWAFCSGYKDQSVQIVPTPELKDWPA